MSMKCLAAELVKDLRGLVWLNGVFFLLIVTAHLLALQRSWLRPAFFMSGLLFCAANYFFVFTYFRAKTERLLDSSYDELRLSMSFDELTGVYNRKAGMARLKEEYARAGRTERRLTLAMVDVDNFKYINDSCGHQTGDQILRHIAGVIKHWLRENDVVFRYGGDEFLLILPETDEKQAVNPLERLREKLADQLIIGGFHLRPSVSIGVATLLKYDEGTEGMIKRADYALYNAKKGGRNRVKMAASAASAPRLRVFNG